MHILIAKARKLDLPFNIQIELFDRCILPILIYGCEVWGHGNLKNIEAVHMKFLKYTYA